MIKRRNAFISNFRKQRRSDQKDATAIFPRRDLWWLNRSTFFMPSLSYRDARWPCHSPNPVQTRWGFKSTAFKKAHLIRLLGLGLASLHGKNTWKRFNQERDVQRYIALSFFCILFCNQAILTTQNLSCTIPKKYTWIIFGKYKIVFRILFTGSKTSFLWIITTSKPTTRKGLKITSPRDYRSPMRNLLSL